MFGENTDRSIETAGRKKGGEEANEETGEEAGEEASEEASEVDNAEDKEEMSQCLARSYLVVDLVKKKNFNKTPVSSRKKI